MDMSEQPVMKPQRELPGFYQTWRERVHGWIEARSNGEVADAILLLPDLLALVIRVLGDPRTPLFFKSQLLIVAMYVLIPVDFVPEAVIGAAGLADDAVIVSVMLLRLLQSASGIDPQVLRDHWSGQGDIVATLQEIVANDGEIVNSNIWRRIRGLVGRNGTPDPVVVKGTFEENL
jgi:uncharacterized membrane protein YkvA (DUF1232 family)